MSDLATAARPVGPFSEEQGGNTHIYTVDLGDGRIAEVEGPANATPEQLQAAIGQQPEVRTTTGDQQVQFGDDPNRVLTHFSPEDEQALQQLHATGTADQIRAFAHQRGFTTSPELDTWVANRDKIRERGGTIDTGVSYDRPRVDSAGAFGAFTNGIAQGATLGFGDELVGLAEGVNSAIHGNGFTDAYDRSVDRTRAELGSDENDHWFSSIAGNLLGGGITPAGVERAGLVSALDRVALDAGRGALRSGASMAEARAIAANAVTRRLAGEGAAYGAAYGAGSTEGGPGERLVGAGEGAALGGIGGAIAGRIAPRLSNRAAPPTENPSAGIMQAADNLGIDLLPADVGGPATRRLTAAAAQTPISASPIITGAQRMTAQAQGARDTIAQSIGEALDPEAAGLSIRAGAQRYIADSGADVRAAYHAAENAAGDAMVTPTQAIAALDRNIGELSQTPGGAPGLATMQALRDELAAAPVTPAGLLRMRTVLRDQFMRDGLVGSDTERRIGQVLDAANNDVQQGLRDAGRPEAARLYGIAATRYRQRIDTINNVLKPLIGTRDALRSGEAVVKTLTADLQGNNGRAVRLLNTLPAESQATARASIIGGLGRSAPGTQNAEGTAFSLAQFLTNWNKIGETAKRAYFGPEARAALNDLATVADATKQAQSYANRSNTAGGIWGNLGVLAGTATVAPISTAIGGATQVITGRLLASPRFARWLARAPRTSLSPRAYAERLTRLATLEPNIASDLARVQERLASSLSSQPMRAAAEGNNETNVVNGQQGQPDNGQYQQNGAPQ